MKKETRAKLRYLRMSPQKVRLVIDLIRGMKVADAVHQLELSTKHAARPVLKLLNSAVANAKHNDEVKEETLVVKTAFVDGGPTLHRWKPRAFGRATPIRKRTSHITIVLEGEVDEKAKKARKAEEVKKAKEAEKKAQQTDKVKEENKDESKEKKTEKTKKDKKPVNKKKENKKPKKQTEKKETKK